jgi:tRNA U34 5-methylaminomethyl-2-thiouridine-forming methyltransferase MnmC
VTGEWAHFLLAGPEEDSWKTYLEPAWADLSRSAQDTLREVEIGFGRGFQTATLLQKWARSGKRQALEIHAFEPFPELLTPWPGIPSSLSRFLPWWGADFQQQGLWKGELDSGAPWELRIHVSEAQDSSPWASFDKVDLFLLDLFSPGKHPEQWRQPLWDLMAAHAGPGSMLTTYSCARMIRDCLQEHGWEPQVLKREGWRDTLVAHFRPTGA